MRNKKNIADRQFKNVKVGQNFTMFVDNRPVYMRKTRECLAIDTVGKEHVIYPDDLCASLGKVVGGMPLFLVSGNPQVVLLTGDSYWEPVTKAQAQSKADELGLGAFETIVFILRGKKQ